MNNSIPLPLAVALATDNYDFEEDTISATSFILPPKIYALSKRVDPKFELNSKGLASMRGTALHEFIERSWENPDEALKKLGYSTKKIEDIKQNFSQEERQYRTLDGVKVSGKPDFILYGTLYDFKETKTFTYTSKSKVEDYIIQGSVYRWLNPKEITSDTISIIYVFGDYKVSLSYIENYPIDSTVTEDYPLMYLKQTENFMKKKIAEFKRYEEMSQEDMPPCTDEEMWKTPDLYKVFKLGGKRAVKSTEDYSEAMIKFNSYPTGTTELRIIKGKANRCGFCPAKEICQQYKQMEK